MQALLGMIDGLDRPIIDRARRLYSPLGSQLDREAVCQVNAAMGTDIATALLYVHFESKLLASAPVGQAKSDTRPMQIAIVPGAFYKEHPEVGGDGSDLQRISEERGWDCQVIPTESLGTLLENAAIITSFLEERIDTRRVILVSLSKGTSDARIGASLRGDLFKRLCGWVSVSGVVHGTRMADWLIDRWWLKPVGHFMCWRHGADRQAIKDLRTIGSPLTKSMPPRTFPCLHLVGFPLRHHLSCRRSRLWHQRFCDRGPNDSVVMLDDFLVMPGTVIPFWGADHYLNSGRNESAIVANLVELLSDSWVMAH